MPGIFITLLVAAAAVTAAARSNGDGDAPTLPPIYGGPGISSDRSMPPGGQIKIINNCSYPLIAGMSGRDRNNNNPTKWRWLNRGTNNVWTITSSDLDIGSGRGNSFRAYPIPLNNPNCGQPGKPACQQLCPDCDKWGRWAGGPLSTTDPASPCRAANSNPPPSCQRAGYMWTGGPGSPPEYNYQDLRKYVAYCNPQWVGWNNSPNACNAKYIFLPGGWNGAWGTGSNFEIVFNGPNGLDYPDLTTNYGSGPMTPCPARQVNITYCQDRPAACVGIMQPIFFNIGYRVDTSVGCTVPDPKVFKSNKRFTCRNASCRQAYWCPASGTPRIYNRIACPRDTGYVLTFCPSGAPLPPLQ